MSGRKGVVAFGLVYSFALHSFGADVLPEMEYALMGAERHCLRAS